MICNKRIQLGNCHHDSFLEHFHYPRQAALCQFAINPTPTPSLRKPLICFLSLEICLFWTFHIDVIIQDAVFRLRLLSLSTGVGRFFSVKGQIIFSALQPIHLCHNHSTLMLEHESSHRQQVNK